MHGMCGHHAASLALRRVLGRTKARLGVRECPYEARAARLGRAASRRCQGTAAASILRAWVDDQCLAASHRCTSRQTRPDR
jgi:hypothetical protein